MAMSDVPLATIPEPVALAAHRALHTQWQRRGQSLPDTGFGCRECVPDIRTVLRPAWPGLLDLARTYRVTGPDLDGDPALGALTHAAADALHRTWSTRALESGQRCADCYEDIEVVLDGIWPLLAAESAR